MKANTHPLVIWTERSAVKEAKSIFCHFDAAIKAIPSDKAEDKTGRGVFVFYLPADTKEEKVADGLWRLQSSKASTIVFYMPNHSSDFAFRVGKLVSHFTFSEAEWAFNLNHLRQLLKARNVADSGDSPSQVGGSEVVQLRKRLGLTQGQLAEAVGVTTRTVQSWEKGLGTSQVKRKMRHLEELTALMDEYVSAPKEQEWLVTPLLALRNRTPRELVASGRARDLVVEFQRLREGQPV